MSSTSIEPSKEGTIPFKIPSIDKPCFTFYKVFGDLSKGNPLICLHGGPGADHRGLTVYGHLWPRYGNPVILYDQIGGGQSTRLPETKGDQSFWQVPLFVDQLNSLIDHFELRDRGYHVLAGSFGSYVASAFAVSRPRGLRRLILASGIASKELSIQSFTELRDELPPEHKEAVLEAGRTRDFQAPAYKEAFQYVVKNYLARADPIPPELLSALKNIDDDRTVMETMSGPSPFYAGGSMAGFTTIPQLHQITAPTLIYNAEFDTSSRDCAQEPFFQLIPRVRWVKLAGAGHCAHLQSPELKEKILKLVGDFLNPPTFPEVNGA
ncbi:proline-specific peptidase [Myriangium duriaei CBS 260.36]|uniref:Proline-specific peptidase n=1 Tax=Myriangium duriaei CBS 260.36 TaxID=1168546 RepID=A0A9P4IXU7_9PEZI|nr:proline-specific peptidase [Myriangium duriaei CBS 260.36]